MVSLVIPLRDVRLAESVQNRNTKSESDNAILITTYVSSFLFAQIHDRDFVVQKISELLSRTKLSTIQPQLGGDNLSLRSSASSSSVISHCDEVKPSEAWKLQPPLMTLYPLDNTKELSEIQAKKEKLWIDHFEEYGRGVSIYRTTETAKLILQGVPDRLRGEVWLSFSGALNEMAMNPGLYQTLVEQSLGKYTKFTEYFVNILLTDFIIL